MSKKMYKPKQENVEKLNRYIEKLQEDGNVPDGITKRHPDRCSEE